MPQIYLDYDQESLDRQLNLRARWPEHVEFFDRWAAMSEAVRAERRCLCDLAYGKAALQRLDLFLPEPSDRPPSLIAFIHGGYWQSLDKSDFSFPAPAFLDHGIAFASLNYSLAPAAKISEMVAEIRQALSWLSDQAESLGIDRQGIVVAGHSAGGHLAAMAGLTDWEAMGRRNAQLRAVVSVSGLYDLEPARLSYHNAVLHLTEEDARDGSPLHRLWPVTVPYLLAVGGDETEEFLRQQKVFAEMSRDRGVPVEEEVLAGQHHFSIVDALANPDHALFGAVRALAQSSR